MIVTDIDTDAIKAQLDTVLPAVAARASDVVSRDTALLVAAVQAQLPAKLAARVTAKIETSDEGASATVTSPFARVRRYDGRIAMDDIAPQFRDDLADALSGIAS